MTITQPHIEVMIVAVIVAAAVGILLWHVVRAVRHGGGLSRSCSACAGCADGAVSPNGSADNGGGSSARATPVRLTIGRREAGPQAGRFRRG